MQFLSDCLVAIIGILLSTAAAVWFSLVEFVTFFARNYKKLLREVGQLETLVASFFLIAVIGTFVWHPWSRPQVGTDKHKPAVTVQEPQEPRGLGKLLPPRNLSFTNGEKKKLVKQYGKDALKGMLLVVAPGHGGKHVKSTYGMDVGCSWVFDRQAYYEAAYTYRMARELGLMAEALGAKVVYAAEAVSMDEVTGPQDPMPLPDGATAYGGAVLNNADDAVVRAKAGAQAEKDNAGQYQKSAFIELHVNSIPSIGWSGLCVYHRRDNIPVLSQLITKAIEGQGYGRKRFGEDEASSIGITFDVLGGYNTIENKVLLECGVPNDDKDIVAQAKDARWHGLSAAQQKSFLGGDSYRLRNPENRRLMLKKVVVGPLVELNKGGG